MNKINMQLVDLLGEVKVLAYAVEQKDKHIEKLEARVEQLARDMMIKDLTIGQLEYRLEQHAAKEDNDDE